MIRRSPSQTIGPVLLALASLTLPPAAVAEDTLDHVVASAEIQQTFGAYKAALSEEQGEEVAKLVSQNTIDYFGGARELALYGTPEELQQRSLTDRMQIVFLRHSIPLETLKSLSAPEVLSYSVDQGWFRGQNVGPVSLGELTMEGNRATAQAVVNGEAVPFSLHFAREDGVWKLDLVPLLSVGDAALHQMAEQRGITGDELILQRLNASGEKVTSAIWQPPLQRGQ